MTTTAVLSFDVDAESAILAVGRRYADHAMAMTHQAFGPRVGVPRILALLAGVPAVRPRSSSPGLTAERYPQTVADVLEAGHEVAHHSWSHRSAVDLDADGERADFDRALTTLQALGVEVKGHRAAMWEASWRTPDLVAEYGLAYDSSLMDSDAPYVLETANGAIAELPPFWGLDDWEQYAFLPRPAIGDQVRSPLVVAEAWVHELDCDAPPRRPVHAHLPPVPVRARWARRGAAHPHRGRSGARGCRVPHRAAGGHRDTGFRRRAPAQARAGDRVRGRLPRVVS